MTEHNNWVEWAAGVLEALGVLTILLGAPFALLQVAIRLRRDFSGWYPQFRRLLGRAILLGLEFLVAADIIRTVSHVPTIQNVAVLAIIVAIRTFLSFTLEVEIDGHWPWQRSERTTAKDTL